MKEFLSPTTVVSPVPFLFQTQLKMPTIKMPTLKPEHTRGESMCGNYPIKTCHLANAERYQRKKVTGPRVDGLPNSSQDCPEEPHLQECLFPEVH